MYLSYFATQCTIPTYKPTADQGNIPPLEASGVGEFCLRELMRGKCRRWQWCTNFNMKNYVFFFSLIKRPFFAKDLSC